MQLYYEVSSQIMGHALSVPVSPSLLCCCSKAELGSVTFHPAASGEERRHLAWGGKAAGLRGYCQHLLRRELWEKRGPC